MTDDDGEPLKEEINKVRNAAIKGAIGGAALAAGTSMLPTIPEKFRFWPKLAWK